MEGNVFAMTLRRWIVHRAIVTYEHFDWAMPLSMRVWMVYIVVMINLGHCNHNQPPDSYIYAWDIGDIYGENYMHEKKDNRLAPSKSWICRLGVDLLNINL